MNNKTLFLLVYWITTIVSFVINFLIGMYTLEDYLRHEILYYVGSFLASSTIGVIIAIIAVITLRRIYHVSN